jgi:hypothetical protein
MGTLKKKGAPLPSPKRLRAGRLKPFRPVHPCPLCYGFCNIWVKLIEGNSKKSASHPNKSFDNKPSSL